MLNLSTSEQLYLKNEAQTTMQTLHVNLADRSYPIFIGQNLFTDPALIRPYVKSKQVCIVTNETIAPLYLAQIKHLFSEFQIAEVILPDGESYKTLDIMSRVFDTLLEQRFDRYCTLVALGGGVIGDMTGFAAACYQRGVPFIQIPTTLLSQVDSSVGGKTGVNHPLGKNMIGAFHQPQCVVIDTDTLSTLADRELSAGFAEVVKYGLINDADFFAWLEQHADALYQRDASLLQQAIARSCQDKADIVGRDELETGERALLNLGHTFGHAVETGCGYGVYLHGEAVAIGMVLAARLSHLHGWMSSEEVTRTIDLLKRFHLPTELPSSLSIEQVLNLMKVDKKVKAGQIRLILMKGIGNALITSEYDNELLKQVLG